MIFSEDRVSVGLGDFDRVEPPVTPNVGVLDPRALSEDRVSAGLGDFDRVEPPLIPSMLAGVVIVDAADTGAQLIPTLTAVHGRLEVAWKLAMLVALWPWVTGALLLAVTGLATFTG